MRNYYEIKILGWAMTPTGLAWTWKILEIDLSQSYSF